MKLIERYIFRRALFALVVATAALVSVVWIAQAIRQVDVVTSQGQGVWLYLWMTSLGVPSLATAVLPVALLLALAHTINALNGDSELIVINASGASKAVIVKPFLLLGLVTALFVWWLAMVAGPSTMLTLRGLVTQVRADLVSVLVQEGQFRTIGDNLTFHVAARAPGGGLKGVMILDQRRPTETFTYLAREGRLEKAKGSAFLVLRDGELQRKVHTARNLSTVRFVSYAFDLSSLAAGRSGGYSSSREIPTADLLFPPQDNPYYRTRPGNFRSELHNRLTAGLYPIAFVLMVLAVAGNARSTRGSFVKVLAFATTFCIVLRALGIAAVSAAKNDEMAVYAVWAVPLIGFALPLFYLVRGRQMEVPAALEWAGRAVGALVRRMSGPVAGRPAEAGS